jgi:hypothetical protein
MQHLEMKSASLRQLPTEADDLARVFKRTIAHVLTALKGGMLFHAAPHSIGDARVAVCFLLGF